MKFQRFRVAMSAAGMALSAAGACVDTSPLDYVAPGLDAGGPDDGGVIRRCRECLSAENGPCAADYEACANDSKCQPALECIIELKCFAFAQIQDKLTCGAPCIAKYDLNSATDPTVAKLIPINSCTAGPCFDACVGK